MPRLTKAQKIEQDNELVALDFFEATLGALPDPRRPQGVRYPLRSVVVISLMATVCGCDDAEAMQLWGEHNADWLEGFLYLPHGPPTQDVFLAVLGALDPEAFGAVFRSWAALLALRLQAEGKHIAVDGKTSRRSIDAMGCQTEIAKTIVEGDGHYLVAVKDNQPTLHEDIATTFVEVADERRRACDEAPRPVAEVFEEADKGHGRVEKRTIALCRDLTWLTTAERWPSLSFIAEVSRERTVVTTGRTSIEKAYYIGSDTEATAEVAGRLIRRHWSIENELHWVLDMAFREDEARHRARNTAQNMTTLRHFALNLVKADKNRKVGVATARKRAGWDRNYLIQLLTSAE